MAVLGFCTHILRDGVAQPLDDAGHKAVQEQIDHYARAGQRVLAFAQRHLEPAEEGTIWRAQDIERNLTLLGLAALQEPPLPEVTQLVEGCRRAGVRVILVTGTYGLTAEAIARRAGIVTEQQVRIIQGTELDELSESELTNSLANKDIIFAQLGAGQKRRVIAALQASGEVVAFLGDSINDAPALKQADIGIALSASGTTVALAAADIVLDAAHPAGLLLAMEEGRAIFSNIQKFSTYIFTHNIAETVVIVAGVLLGVPLPLTVVQVLAIDLGAELFPSIALSTEPPEPGILDRPPRRRTAPLLDRSVVVRAFAWLGMIEGGLALLAYMLGYWSSGWRPGQPFTSDNDAYALATTLAYAAIVMAQVGNALASRTRRVSLLEVGLLTNRALLVGVLASVALMLVLIYVPPLATVFGFVAPAPVHWLVLLTFPPIMLAAEEGRKWWARRRVGSDQPIQLDRPQART
jgi:magnesium-transporting ATPase (P-type)